MGWIADLLQEIPSAARYKIELEKLESEHAVLKSENGELRAQLEAANLEIQRLNEQIKEKSGSHKSDRSEVETKILVMLSAGHDPTAEQVSRYIGQSVEAAKYHLNELRKIEFVQWRSDDDREEIQWSLDQAGRGYLMKRDLLK